MKTQLKVFARLKPNETQPISYDIDRNGRTLVIGQKQNKAGFINNMKETIEFNFEDILDTNATQEQVFQQVAVPVVMNCLDGYNGTVFAYGQTGSGKTFTINGSDSWAQRGIIPRVMTHIFDVIDVRKEEFEYKVYASYMEIYNEKAYDLLNEDHLVSPLEQWSKIEFKRDHAGNIHLSNISLHEIDDAKPGIDLLMMGNYIRKQAATPMNQCSSRSHCIFTLTFEARSLETGACFVSKLNLVDLAGSERVSKTNHDGNLLNEAKNINLSLSYLEQVIVALNEKKRTGQRQHIPYRHSILTTILKDSLGGNCKTVMIANVSTEIDNFEETISALRFSQRVGQLENEIHRNQKIDLNAQIEKLEQEKLILLGELEKYQRIAAEHRMIGTSSAATSVSHMSLANHQEIDEAEDLDRLLTKVDDYMTEKTDVLHVSDMVEARLCFRAMKEYHKSTMADYLHELSEISNKLKHYDALFPINSGPQQLQQSLSQAHSSQQQQQQYQRDSEITEMAIHNYYLKKRGENGGLADENRDPEKINFNKRKDFQEDARTTTSSMQSQTSQQQQQQQQQQQFSYSGYPPQQQHDDPRNSHKQSHQPPRKKPIAEQQQQSIQQQYQQVERDHQQRQQQFHTMQGQSVKNNTKHAYDSIPNDGYLGEINLYKEPPRGQPVLKSKSDNNSYAAQQASTGNKSGVVSPTLGPSSTTNSFSSSASLAKNQSNARFNVNNQNYPM